MSENIILQGLSQEDIAFDGFFDGRQLIIPEGAELKCMVTDIFIGYKESSGLSACIPTLTVIEQGTYHGQSYNFNLKIYDLDPKKRDLALRNLSVIDYQAGFVMTKNGMPVSMDNALEHWVNKAVVRAKFGLLVAEDGREINFIRGLGYSREDIFTPQQPQQPQQQGYPPF